MCYCNAIVSWSAGYDTNLANYILLKTLTPKVGVSSILSPWAGNSEVFELKKSVSIRHDCQYE